MYSKPSIIACFVLLFSLNSISQNISYSEKEHAGNYSYHIIGQVKNHIIIWKYNFESYRVNSEIIVDDLNMHTLKRINSKILETGRLVQINFINNTDSFDIIFQCSIKKNIICKQATFDENGNCLNLKTIKNNANNTTYQFFASADNKSFALVNTTGNDSLNFFKIDYTFISKNLQHSGSQIFPFNFKTSKINNAVINDNNLIFSTSSTIDSSFQLHVFKINLETDSVINTIRLVQDGYLVENTVTINSFANDYIISANWTNKISNGVFLWRLNKDLSDEVTDTVIEKNQDSSSVVFNINNFSVNTYQNFKQIDNLFVFLSSTGIPWQSEYAHSPNVISNYSPPQFSSDLFAFMANPSDNTNGVVKGVVYNNTLNKWNNFPSSISNTTNNYYEKPETLPETSKVSILKMNNENKVLNQQTFKASFDKYVISNINNAKVVTGQNSLYMMFNQTGGKKPETYGYLKINTESLKYTYSNVIIMNLKYKLLLESSVQINDNTLIVPCSQNEYIAFAKIVFN